MKRTIRQPERTIGTLAIDGAFECFTLEDPVREPFVKVPGQTAIPAGTYEVIIDQSARFHRLMPLLVNVPEFKGVRIHPGNTEANTEGCILVGLQIPPERDRLLASRIAFETLFGKMTEAVRRGERMEIEVKNGV